MRQRRGRTGRALLCAALFPAFGAVHAAKAPEVAVNGYLEYRKGEVLVIDAQRVKPGGRTKFRGTGEAKSVRSIPLGYEVKVRGKRAADGTVTASYIEARPNEVTPVEAKVLAATAQAEASYVKEKAVFEPGPEGNKKVIGTLLDSGPQQERADRIVSRLLPSYIDDSKVRVYVVDNKEWNAMAMANYSIYVYSGLMKDLDDDEVAVVLGHEIAHASHEHSRKQAKKGVWAGIAGTVAAVGAGMIDNSAASAGTAIAGMVGATAFMNVYSRDAEDQADRVGLRYVYEAGYDVAKAPELWRRFAEKYGDGSKASNFFFGDHSLSAKRASDLEREIANNYRDPALDPPVARKLSAP